MCIFSFFASHMPFFVRPITILYCFYAKDHQLLVPRGLDPFIGGFGPNCGNSYPKPPVFGVQKILKLYYRLFVLC